MNRLSRWLRRLFKRRYRITQDYLEVLVGDTGKTTKSWNYYVDTRDWNKRRWVPVRTPPGNVRAFMDLTECKDYIKRIDFRMDLVGTEEVPTEDNVPDILLRAYRADGGERE